MAESILIRLAERGHDIHVLTGRPDASTEQEEHVGQGPKPVYRTLHRISVDEVGREGTFAYRLRTLAAYVRNYGAVKRAIREVQPQGLFFFACGTLTTAVLAAAQQSGIPLAFHLDDEWLIAMSRWAPLPTLSGRFSGVVRKWCGPELCMAPQDWCMLHVSRDLQQRYHAAGLEGRVDDVVYNGVDHPSPPRARPTGDSGGLCIGFAGRLEENKGVRLLLEAVEKIAADRPEVIRRVEVAGAGSLSGWLQEQSRVPALTGILSLAGKLDPEQMRDFYHRQDVIVMPSLWREPFGLVAVESLSESVPVLVSTRGALPEILPPDIGLRFEPDAGALQRALMDLYSRRAGLTELGEKGARYVRQHFSWPDKIDTIEAAVKEQFAG